MLARSEYELCWLVGGDSSVGIVPTVKTGHTCISLQNKKFPLFFITDLQPSQLDNGSVPKWCLAAVVKWLEFEPVTDLHLVPRLRMNGSLTPLPGVPLIRAPGLCLYPSMLLVDRTCYNVHTFTPVILQGPPAVFKLRNIRASVPSPPPPPYLDVPMHM